MTTGPAYLGTPEGQDPPTPVNARITRVDFDDDETWWQLRIEMSEPAKNWIADRTAGRCTITRLGDRYAAFIGAKLARELFTDAGKQLPVTHESHEVYSCLGNIINRFDFDD